MASLQELTDYLISEIQKRISLKDSKTIIRYNDSPEDLLKQFDFTIPKEQTSGHDIFSFVKKIIDKSVVTNHPYFMNQMYGKTQPIAYLADVLITLLNTSMYTFEVAPVLTLIEKETIKFLTKKIWKNEGDGVFTAGGSISNMKAMFLARQQAFKQAHKNGLSTLPPVSIFVSDQAHYSFVKGVNFMGFGINALVKIPSNQDATINIKALKESITNSKKNGRYPLMLVGIGGTTTSATFDPLEELHEIAKQHDMWYHVDACFGGALLFSDQDNQQLKGIDLADSVSWNFHKVMGMPLSTASFLTKEKGLLNKAFHVNADYLFHESEYDYDLGQKSLQGGRRPEMLKLWLSLKYKGENGFSNHINSLRQKALDFSHMIEQRGSFELFQIPQSTIVCFRYKHQNLSDQDLDNLNKNVRESIFDEGKIIFNYAILNHKIYLRFVVLDPNFTDEQLKHILDTIESKVQYFLKLV